MKQGLISALRGLRQGSLDYMRLFFFFLIKKTKKILKLNFGTVKACGQWRISLCFWPSVETNLYLTCYLSLQS